MPGSVCFFTWSTSPLSMLMSCLIIRFPWFSTGSSPQPPSTAPIAPPPTPLAPRRSPPPWYHGPWSWPPARCLAPNFHNWLDPNKNTSSNESTNRKKNNAKEPKDLQTKQPKDLQTKQPKYLQYNQKGSNLWFVGIPVQKSRLLHLLRGSGHSNGLAAKSAVPMSSAFGVLSIAILLHGIIMSSSSQKFQVGVNL